MSTLLEQATREMTMAIHAWFDERLQRMDLDDAVNRTTLQAGVFSDFMLDYKPGRTTADDIDLGFDDDVRPRTPVRLDDAQVRDLIAPQLAALVQARLAPLVNTPMIDYRFTFRGKFQTAQGKLHLTLLEYVNDNKRQLLLERIHAYVDRKLTHGTHPTEKLETFFLTRHLLDKQLFPQLDVTWTIAQFDRIQALNKASPDTLAEHRHDIIRAITGWAENEFLPQYYDRVQSAYRATEYALKAAVALDAQAMQPIDLLLYGAVMILRHEPSYAKSKGLKFLEIARELGSERAARMLKEGSGTFAPDAIHLKNALLECRANDVFATISITIAREEEGAYAQALAFITHLLNNGFPKSCQIKLKSKVKQYLPVKGLARSDTHRFFANALAYAALQPQLEAYARAAIAQYEFYADTEGEKNCMPGSYATFGLGLLDARYFPLVQHYMANVDEEHQSVQDQFTAAFAEQYGVTRDSAPVLATCLRACTDSAKVKIQVELEDVEKLELFCQQLQGLEGYLVEHMLYPIWGKLEKLAALARKADGRRKHLLLALLEAASKADV
ncbi:hypothetical protein IGS59_11330 [Janthinobacterium sp. GW460P]|uniref:DUF6138 family protein n=1 Tax=unclassified Janthinobacterium TaxID=2610881 RepID=UPI000A329570|nr:MULTISPECIES: DUF6138 family protein [unclassified Janthinobacterium]MCC7702836.1 hypothetical protein [Janthinobacterium sp. GW460P]MCC7708344.1 hypothetical protein [Janthinobacterium sp. GW460W]